MLDRYARDTLAPTIDRVVSRLVGWGVPANALTAAGLVLGFGAAVAAGAAAWRWALALWLVSRVADGLDGPVARLRTGGTELGGYLDILFDFAVYGAFVVGCGIGEPEARVALLVLLGTYYVNGTAFLAFSSLVERRRETSGFEDERSLVFPGGLAEGTETIVAHSLLVVFPSVMATIAWVFAAMVVVTFLQRVRFAVRTFSRG